MERQGEEEKAEAEAKSLTSRSGCMCVRLKISGKEVRKANNWTIVRVHQCSALMKTMHCDSRVYANAEAECKCAEWKRRSELDMR